MIPAASALSGVDHISVHIINIGFTDMLCGVANSQAHQCNASAIPVGLTKINREYCNQ